MYIDEEYFDVITLVSDKIYTFYSEESGAEVKVDKDTFTWIDDKGVSCDYTFSLDFIMPEGCPLDWSPSYRNFGLYFDSLYVIGP